MRSCYEEYTSPRLLELQGVLLVAPDGLDELGVHFFSYHSSLRLFANLFITRFLSNSIIGCFVIRRGNFYTSYFHTLTFADSRDAKIYLFNL